MFSSILDAIFGSRVWFSGLRMSEEEYQTYRAEEARKHGPPFIPFGRYQTAGPVETQPPLRIKVVGFGEDVQRAITASDSRGFLDIQWNGSDTLKAVMDRVEAQLRIPCKYWRLAGDGYIVSKWFIGDTSSVNDCFVFDSSRPERELHLVHMSQESIQSYESQHTTINSWRTLDNGKSDAYDPRERSHAIFHLINPEKGSDFLWQVYLQRRLHDESFISERAKRKKQKSGMGLINPVLSQVNSIITPLMPLGVPNNFVLCDGVIPIEFDNVVLSEPKDAPITPMTVHIAEISKMGLPIPEEEPKKIHDLHHAQMRTRIYSPCRPACVDVFLYYHHEIRSRHVEFTCHLLYHVQDPIGCSAPSLPESPYTQPADGWKKVFFQRPTNAPGQIHPGIEAKWDLTLEDVGTIRAALFGTAGFSTEVGDYHIISMLFASIGLALWAEIGPERPPGQNRKLEVNREDYQDMWDIRWMLDDADVAWLAANVRRTCGYTYARDKKILDGTA